MSEAQPMTEAQPTRGGMPPRTRDETQKIAWLDERIGAPESDPSLESKSAIADGAS